MLYVILFVICLASFAAALYFFLKFGETTEQLRSAEVAWREEEEKYASELARLEKIRHVPDVIDRAMKMKSNAETTLSAANQRAETIVQGAVEEGQARSKVLVAEAEALAMEARAALGLANRQARDTLEEARREAKELASKARKDAKEKREQAESALLMATKYAHEIRHKAERRAEEIGGDAYRVQGMVRDLEATARAYQNRIEEYRGVHLAPATHVLDELAVAYGFDKAGSRLKLARERTRLMRANGTAATCGYPDGWKKDHALKFMLGSFDGKVDTILSRLKSNNQGRLVREIKDAYATVNADGEVYKDARIHEEYLDSRLEEVKWGAAVLKLKEDARAEQRAIREQIREERRAQMEFERAAKQAERERELVNKAMDRLRRQMEESSGAEKARLESQLQEMEVKLAESEERNRRALSMAQQTRRGTVYVISNLGSFGENVYKVGLTRRLDPIERILELGDASVPFPFDVHALLASEDAPALETALHRKFVEKQVNKINRRKEYFRIDLQELKATVEAMGVDCTWTMAHEASQYRATLELEAAMRSDVGLRKKWMDEQATAETVEEEFEDEEQEPE